MRMRRIAGKESDVANPHYRSVHFFDMLRGSYVSAPSLQRLNRRKRVVINAIAEPAKTSHRMRALPGLMQCSGEVNATGRNQPRPFERLRSAAKNGSGKRDMAISTGGQRIVADHNQAQGQVAAAATATAAFVWNMPANARSTIGSDWIMRALSVRNHSASSSGDSDAALRPCRVVNR